MQYDGPIEQIDGAVHVDELHALVECKDYGKSNIKVEPLAKMRNQLARRRASVFGMFFSATDYTTPAQIQVIKDQMAKKLNSREALAELSRFMPFSIVSQIVYRDHEKLVLSIFKSQNKFDRFVFYHMK